jgi:hypothetical protein
MPAFPVSLLTHSVRVYRRTTAVTDGEPVETGTLLGTAACLISEVEANRGVNEQDGTLVYTAALSGFSLLLGSANVRFEVVKGPFAANTVLFPEGGQTPHGEGAGIRRFYRFRVSTVATG